MLNLLYINTHDTGRMISPYGFDIPTPTLQELSKDGTLFTHAYCCGPTCSPSRSALLTGTYPHQNGMLGLAQRGFSLNDPSRHLASYLQKCGYHTAISGIQHEVGWYLDLDIDAVHELGYQDVLTTSSKGFSKEDLHIWDRKNVESAIKWIENMDPSKPFMLSYGMHSTHRPYPIDVADNIDERYVRPPYPIENNEGNRHDQAQFMTTAQYADENIALLLKAIKEKGLYENTVILYTTDHGVAIPFHKCNLTDSGIGVSMIIRNPKSKNQGEVVDQVVSQIDVFPTLCDVLELKKPEYLEGESFAEIFKDTQTPLVNEAFAEVNYHTSYEPIRCIRTQRYKYIRYFDLSYQKINCSNMDESQPKKFMVENGLKDKIKEMERLYDCFFDPGEGYNLVGHDEYQEVLIRMREKLKRKMEQTNDPLLSGELEFKPIYKVNKKTCMEASSKNPEDYDERGRK